MSLASLFLYPESETNVPTFRCMRTRCPIRVTSVNYISWQDVEHVHDPEIACSPEILRGMLDSDLLKRDTLALWLRTNYSNSGTCDWDAFLDLVARLPLHPGRYYALPDRSHARLAPLVVHRFKECPLSSTANYRMATVTSQTTRDYELTECPRCNDLSESEFRPILALILYWTMTLGKLLKNGFRTEEKRRREFETLMRTGRKNKRGAEAEYPEHFFEFLDEAQQQLGLSTVDRDKILKGRSSLRNYYKNKYEEYRNLLTQDNAFAPAFRQLWLDRFQ